jgi:hypothetical protein
MVARIYVGLVVVMLLGGGSYLFAPDLFEMNGQPLTSAAARADVRAMYGALSIGLGLYLSPGVLRAVPRLDELRFCFLAFGALALGRLLGILAEGGDQSFNYAATALEAVLAVAGLLLWLRRRRGASTE